MDMQLFEAYLFLEACYATLRALDSTPARAANWTHMA